MALPMPVQRLDAVHMTPGFIAERPRVHRQRSAQRARNAAEELTLREAPVIAAARDARARHAGLTVDAGLRAPLDAREGARRGHDHATDTAIAHQQIAAQTDPVDRYLGRQRAQERGQILDVARTEEHVGRAADTP